MIKPRATIQLTIMELVIGKPKTRVISTAFCDRVCSSRSGVAAGWGACSELPCAATALAGVAEARAGGAPAANAEPALRPTNTARKTSTDLASRSQVLRLQRRKADPSPAPAGSG